MYVVVVITIFGGGQERIDRIIGPMSEGEALAIEAQWDEEGEAEAWPLTELVRSNI